MRPGQHNNNNNNKRNRNRNRRHSNMGSNSGGGGGGNNANRVYDSNGPDVKLRGTAQTIAEKYMQLGRDAQSSGDSVMAESYYQFGDHYYRLWLAAQPAGQPLQFSRRMAEEEMEDEAGEGGAEGDDDGQNGETPVAEGAEAVSASDEGAEQLQSDGQPLERQNRQRDFQPRDNNNRDGNRNFRQRWPRRNDRSQQQDGNGQPVEGTSEGQEPRQERPERYERPQPVEAANEAGDNWEAPSFLKRPTPAPAEDMMVSEEPTTPAPAPRARRSRAEPKTAPEDAPQGD